MRDDELRTMLYNTQMNPHTIQQQGDGIRTRLPLFIRREYNDDAPLHEILHEWELRITTRFPQIARWIRAAINVIDNAGI